MDPKPIPKLSILVSNSKFFSLPPSGFEMDCCSVEMPGLQRMLCQVWWNLRQKSVIQWLRDTGIPVLANLMFFITENEDQMVQHGDGTLTC